MEQINMTPEQEKLINELNLGLAVLKTELPQIRESLGKIEKNLTLAEGESTLRDSVIVLVGKQMKDQREACCVDMDNAAKKLIDAHEKEFHKRTSTAPRQATNWNGFLDAFGPFLIRWMLPLLAAAGSGVGIKTLIDSNETPPAQTAPERIGE